ncbi:hypothetical protein [uncultured Veillonella sp.]|uniref:hypothetical protein n=1 Tax=uncultured Veillonella sp. TaxID=159268 RepID=UPI00265F3464|nr:hypothetical protein [uncultured Veillonella sp.]
MNNYIHVLDADGRRITSIVDNMIVPIGEAALLKQAKEQYPNAAQYIYGGDAMLDAFLDGKAYVNGEFVEPPIVEYIPTKEEKINAIKAEYEPRFKTLEEAQRRLLLMGKPTTAISAQYIKLNGEMVARIKEVQ